MFLPEAKGEKAEFAMFSRADKTFVAKEVAPGKYKIVVAVAPLPGGPENPKHGAELAAFNKGFDPTSTKLVYEVTTDSSQSIILDLTKGTVTKK